VAAVAGLIDTAAVAGAGSIDMAVAVVAGSTGLAAAVGGLTAGRCCSKSGVPNQIHRPLVFLPSALAEKFNQRPCVVVVRNQAEFRSWLSNPVPWVQWLQVEQLLPDPDVWTFASRGISQVPLDVVLADPAAEFCDLYRLVDVCAVRDVRVSLPAAPGLLKAVKLATPLGLPIRILPGQPTPEVLVELSETLEFYLHETMVEVPVEFFHSLLASACGANSGSIWTIVEEDPAEFLHCDPEGNPRLPRSSGRAGDERSLAAFVETHFERLIEQGAECAACPWSEVCRGYFKWPEPSYSCAQVKPLLSRIAAAATEICRDLAEYESGFVQSEVKSHERPNL
jgi:hypothetical protein